MAGCRVSLKVSVPNRCCTSSQPHAAPGTVTSRMPPGGIPDPGDQLAESHEYPSVFMRSRVAPVGALPLAFSVYSLFSRAM